MTPSQSNQSTSNPDQRRLILDAAVEVLSERGPAAFTVRSVADAAGCSTTGVYTWFGNKAGLADAIFVDGFDRFDQAIFDAYPDREFEDPVGALEACRWWALEHPIQYVVMFGRAIPDHEPSIAARDRALESFGFVELCLAAYLESVGATPAGRSLRELATELWATMHGLVMLELTNMLPPAESQPPDLFRTAVRRTLSGLAAQP